MRNRNRSKTSVDKEKAPQRLSILRRGLQRIGPFPIAILAFVVLVGILQPRFLTWTNLQNLFRQIPFLALLSLGAMLPLLAEGFDLSPGGTVGLVSVVCVMVGKSFGITSGIMAGLAVGGLFGLINGFFISCKYRLNPFVVTLGTMYAAQGISLYITNGVPVYGIPREFTFIGAGTLGQIPVSILITVVFYVFFHVLLTRTYFGRVIYAIGGNEVAAVQSGINARLYRTLVYVVCGLMTGVGAVVLTSRVMSGEPTMGYQSSLQAIAAVLIGGVSLSGGEGTVINVVFGVVLLALLSNSLNLLGVSSYIQTITIGCVIILAVLFDRYRRTIAGLE